MNYAGALLNGRSAQPVQKPIARPAPSPIAPPKASTSAQTATVERGDPRDSAGLTATLPERAVARLVHSADEAASCSLAVTCRHMLALVGPLLASTSSKPKKPLIRFKLDVAGSAGDVEEADDEATEVKGEGKILSLPLSQFQRDSARMKLVSYWLDTVTQVQTERDDKIAKTNSTADPLALASPSDLKVKLGGGFTIDQAGKQSSKRLYASTSLADVHTWLDACIALLQGSMRQELNLDNGTVVLQRYGRGGSQLIVRNGDERAVFDLADFMLGIRQAAKEFLPFVGRCVVTLKNGVKQFQQEGEAEKYIEREKAIKTVLQHQNLDRALKSIKNLLEVGSVPGSNLPQLFAKKRAEKARAQSQAFKEYDNMYEFVVNNLPADYEDAKAQAEKLSEEAAVNRELAYQRRQEERERAFEERKAKENGKLSEKDVNQVPEKVKKDKKVETKTVDKDGWVTKEVNFVRPDGTVVKTAGAVAEVEAPAQGKKNKKKKGKKNGEQQQQQQQQPAKVEKRPEEASREYLEKNPFALAMKETSFDSTVDAQHKKNMQKVTQAPAAATKQQNRPKENVQKAPKTATNKAAAPKQKKAKGQQAKKMKDAKRAMKAKVDAKEERADWLLPVMAGAVVVAVAGVAYTLLLG